MASKKLLEGWIYPFVALVACLAAGISSCWLAVAQERSEFLRALGFLAATVALCVLARRLYKRWDFLVGVVICAGGGAIVAPVVQSARWSGSSEDCQAYLGQLHRALVLYTGDHDERMPLASNWRGSTRQYLETPRPLRCPNAVAPYSYALNDKVSGRYVAGLPPETVCLFECEAYLENASGGKEWQVNRHKGLEWLATVEGTRRARMGRKDQEFIWKPPLP